MTTDDTEKELEKYQTHLETQFGQLNDIIDRVAERIRTLGHYSPATLKSFFELSAPRGGGKPVEKYKQRI